MNAIAATAAAETPMWEQYKKTAVATQLFIFTITLGSIFLGGTPLPAAAVLFVFMQVCAVLGARSAMRLKKKDAARNGDLPLRPR
jgi:hypothetical protein